MLLGNGVVLKYIMRGANQPVQSIDCGAVERDGRGGLRVRDDTGHSFRSFPAPAFEAGASSEQTARQSMGI